MMKKLFLSFFCLLFLSQDDFSIPSLHLGFESGDFYGWKLSRLSNKDAAKILNSPVRAGKYSASVTLGPGETYGDSWKSELSDDHYAPYNKEMWYRVSHYLPKSFDQMNQGNVCVIAQWHNVSPKGLPGGGPPIAHEFIGNDQLRIFISYSKGPFTKTTDVISKTLFIVPFAKQVWHDFVYRVVWNRFGHATFDVWHNGKYLGTYAGRLGYINDAAGPYFKTGVYCKKSPTIALTAFVDEYRRGPTKESVLLPDESIEMKTNHIISFE